MPARPAAPTSPAAAGRAATLARRKPDLSLEHAFAPAIVCGVDEAGRGPWAGPVCAAAVVLRPGRRPPAVDDSKKLTAKAREALEVEIKAVAVSWAVAFASEAEILDLNILHATGLAMCRAVEALRPRVDAALVDGNYAFKLPCRVKTVVGGDGLSASVAAASILAKTARDRLMIELDALHPGYGFARHKGYHAAEHVAALRELGPCPIHRRGWAPIRAVLEGGDVGAPPALLAALLAAE